MDVSQDRSSREAGVSYDMDRGNNFRNTNSRNVQFQEDRNQVVDLEAICVLCGEDHEDSLRFVEVKPWEVATPFVDAAVPGSGFFVIPDVRNKAPSKELHQAVIEILEGNPSGRDIEKEFTQWAGESCT